MLKSTSFRIIHFWQTGKSFNIISSTLLLLKVTFYFHQDLKTAWLYRYAVQLEHKLSTFSSAHLIGSYLNDVAHTAGAIWNLLWLFLNWIRVEHLAHHVISIVHSWHPLSHSDILSWPPNHHQAPANSGRRKIPYLCVFKDRRDSTCSLSVSEVLEDLLTLASSLKDDSCGLSLLASSFLRGTAFDWKRFFLIARTELTFPRKAESPRRSLGFTDGGILSLMRDSALICLLLTRWLLSLRDKGLPQNGLGRLSSWGLSLRACFGSPCSTAGSEEGMPVSDILLLRGPATCLSWGLLW